MVPYVAGGYVVRRRFFVRLSCLSSLSLYAYLVVFTPLYVVVSCRVISYVCFRGVRVYRGAHWSAPELS